MREKPDTCGTMPVASWVLSANWNPWEFINLRYGLFVVVEIEDVLVAGGSLYGYP